jgi:3-keto-disaccharide hydrolase
MVRFAGAVLLALLLLPGLAVAGGPDEQEWIPLFNGRDLEGWIPKITGHEVGENFADTFRVVKGVLTVSYDGYEGDFGGRFGHLFYRVPFSYYRLVVEYRFVGEQAEGGPEWGYRNSGIMIHGQPASTMTRDQDFPISIEVQLLGGRSTGPRPTANLCTPGTNVVRDDRLVTEHCINSTAPTFRGDEWVRVEVEVHGDGVIRHRVNGEEVLAYEMPQIGGGSVAHFDSAVKRDGELLSGGSISLQSESHPVEFRKVELLDLEGCTDPGAANYKSYYLKAEPAACRYR